MLWGTWLWVQPCESAHNTHLLSLCTSQNSSPDCISFSSWTYTLLQSLSCFTLALLLNQCCIILSLWLKYCVGLLDTGNFTLIFFVTTVFYISVYTNSCLVGWLKASVRSLLCLSKIYKVIPLFSSQQKMAGIRTIKNNPKQQQNHTKNSM